MTAEVQQAKNVYEALNAQLLDELPKLYGLSMEIVRECVVKLVQSQRNYLSQAIEEIYQLLGVSCWLCWFMNVEELFITCLLYYDNLWNLDKLIKDDLTKMWPGLYMCRGSNFILTHCGLMTPYGDIELGQH